MSSFNISVGIGSLTKNISNSIEDYYIQEIQSDVGERGVAGFHSLGRPSGTNGLVELTAGFEMESVQINVNTSVETNNNDVAVFKYSSYNPGSWNDDGEEAWITFGRTRPPIGIDISYKMITDDGSYLTAGIFVRNEEFSLDVESEEKRDILIDLTWTAGIKGVIGISGFIIDAKLGYSLGKYVNGLAYSISFGCNVKI